MKRADKVVLRGASLTITPGVFSAVIGPNGAGKSTLLSALAGDLETSAGAVELDGQALRSVPLRDLARRRAVLPQASDLSFPFSVLDVVLMGRTPHLRGREGPADLAIARAALARVGLEALASRPYPRLSGGERQRVHLARALAQVWPDDQPSAKYLLLDEPTASQDLASQHRVIECARAFADEGGAVLAVLHDLNLVARYADHVLLLAGGAPVAQGAADDVLTTATLAGAYRAPVAVIHPRELDHPLVVPFPQQRTP